MLGGDLGRVLTGQLGAQAVGFGLDPWQRFEAQLRLGQLSARQFGGVSFLGDVVGGAYQVGFDLSEAAGQFGFFGLD